MGFADLRPQSLRRSCALRPASRLLGPASQSLFILLATSVVWTYLLQPSRGLDATDESLYLLQATNTDRETAWIFPVDWHLSALFRLSGYDVARFRVLGSVLLTIAGIALAKSLQRYWSQLEHEAGEAPVSSRSSTPVEDIAVLIVLPAATHFYYTGFLRTPSYNFVNAVGIILAATGLIRAVTVSMSLQLPKVRHFVGPSVCVAGGLLFAVPGRPSTAPLGLLIVIASVAVAGDAATVVKWVSTLALSFGSLLLLLIFVGPWPRSLETVGTVFLEGLRFPPLVASQSLGGGFLGQVVALNSILRLTVTISPFVLFGLVVVALAILSPAMGLGSQVARGSTSIIAAMLLGVITLTQLTEMNEFLELIRGGTLGISWAYLPISEMGLRLLLLSILLRVLLWQFGRSRHIEAKPHLGHASKSEMSIVGGLIFLALLFGFGSSNGVLAMSAHVVVLYCAAALVLLGAAPSTIRRRAQRAMFVSIVAALGVVIYASQISPYRIAPISDQTVRISHLPSIQGSLYVDEGTSLLIDRVRSLAEFANIPSENVVVTVAGWPSLYQLVLGSALPESLMLTLYGHDNSLAVASHNLNRLDPNWIRDAWILTSTRAAEGLAPPDETEVLALVASMTSRDFPADFVCLGATGSEAVFRPRMPGEATATKGCPIVIEALPR